MSVECFARTRQFQLELGWTETPKLIVSPTENRPTIFSMGMKHAKAVIILIWHAIGMIRDGPGDVLKNLV